MPQEGERGGGHRFRMLGICRRDFPVFDCPFCETGMMIPKQVIEETKAAKQKEKHLADQKEKTFVYDYNQM